MSHACASILTGLWLLQSSLTAIVSAENDERIISAVDLYGLRRVAEADVRSAIAIEVGKPLPYSPEELQRRLEAMPGVKRIDLTPTCFPETGCVLHIGIDEGTMEPIEFRPAPEGLVELPREIKEAAGEFQRLFDEALARGEGREDYSQGHPLAANPEVRASQERLTALAEKYGDDVRRVLHESVAGWQRAVAAEVLCYASDKSSVAADLLQAMRDAEDEVRNNAMRCLGAISFLASRNPDLEIKIEATPFIEMLKSFVWTDRQKAVFVLENLTHNRDPKVLRALRAGALRELIVMGHWKSIYGMQPFLLLGRVAGISDKRLKAVWANPVEREKVLRELETTNSLQPSEFKVSEFDAIVSRFVDNGYAKGIVIALVRGDSVEIRAHGQVTEGGATPDAHTLFEIGSIAKVFVGTTLATMVTDGDVALEAPLADFLPSSARVPEHSGKPITLLTLATHSSGLPPFRTWKTEWDMAWYHEFLSRYELARDPGARYEYSNLGFLLLEEALSFRSKKPCGELMKARVLDPIGMQHTIIGEVPSGAPHAAGHERSGVPAPPLDGECVMSSDATDMAAFLQANLDPPPPLREAMAMAQAEHGSRPGGKIGLAWNIGLGEAPGVLWHTGGTMGFRSYLALDVERQVGVVVLANTSTEAVTALGYALFQVLRGEPYDLALPRLVSLSPETLERCTGRFELERDFYLNITLERGVLFAQFTEGLKHSIYPSSETTFHFIVDDVRLEFEMGSDGRARRVVIHAPGETAPADRVD